MAFQSGLSPSVVLTGYFEESVAWDMVWVSIGSFPVSGPHT